MADRRQVTVAFERRYGRRAWEVLDRLREAQRAAGGLTAAGVDAVARDVGIQIGRASCRERV